MFRSFWSGGYESATHINGHGERLDMIAGIQHDQRALQDYLLLRSVRIQTARDGLRWHLIDKGGSLDFSSFLPMLRAARHAGVQVIWDLCHYGWPDDLDVLSPRFVDRFARFAKAAAELIRDETEEIPFYVPVNEISFLSWGASRSLIFPHLEGKDNPLKEQFVRASVAAIESVRTVDSRARIVHPEPVIRVVPPNDSPQMVAEAAAYTESQYEAWDMLAGFQKPQLGGKPEYLDILGLNFYHSNQWVHGNGRLRWEDEPRDPRWLPFSEMLAKVWKRLQRPIFVAETGHFGAGRARWVREIGQEVLKAVQAGVPVEGVCLYPILDRYDWQDKNHWHNSGLWDISLDPNHCLDRVLNQEFARALSEVQELLAKAGKH